MLSKKNTLILLLSLGAAAAHAETAPVLERIYLSTAGISFELPERLWREETVGRPEDPDVIAVRAFSRTPLSPSSSKRPGLIVSSEKIPGGTDLRAFSMSKLDDAPPHDLDEDFKAEPGTPGAAVYRLVGTGEASGMIAYTAYAVAGGTGYTLVVEVPRSGDAKMRGEVEVLLKSLRMQEPP